MIENLKAYINPSVMELDDPKIKGKGYWLTSWARIDNGKVLDIDFDLQKLRKLK